MSGAALTGAVFRSAVFSSGVFGDAVFLGTVFAGAVFRGARTHRPAASTTRTHDPVREPPSYQILPFPLHTWLAS